MHSLVCARQQTAVSGHCIYFGIVKQIIKRLSFSFTETDSPFCMINSQLNFTI